VSQPVTIGMLLIPGTYEVLQDALRAYVRTLRTERGRLVDDLGRALEEIRKRRAIPFVGGIFPAPDDDPIVKDLRRRIAVYDVKISSGSDNPFVASESLVVGRHTVNVDWTTDGTKVTKVNAVDARFDYGNQSYIQFSKSDEPKASPGTAVPADTNVVNSVASIEGTLSQPVLKQLSDLAGSVPKVGEAVKYFTSVTFPLRYKSRITVRDNVRFTDFAPGRRSPFPATASVAPVTC
jgi:hypothetical protein